MDRHLVMEAGVPTAVALPSADAVEAGLLPAGRYVTTTHVGHPSELVQVTGGLLDWVEQQRLSFDVQPSADGEVWGCRLEWMETDPAVEPDMNRWQTRLAFRLAD